MFGKSQDIERRLQNLELQFSALEKALVAMIHETNNLVSYTRALTEVLETNGVIDREDVEEYAYTFFEDLKKEVADAMNDKIVAMNKIHSDRDKLSTLLSGSIDIHAEA